MFCFLPSGLWNGVAAFLLLWQLFILVSFLVFVLPGLHVDLVSSVVIDCLVFLSLEKDLFVVFASGHCFQLCIATVPSVVSSVSCVLVFVSWWRRVIVSPPPIFYWVFFRFSGLSFGLFSASFFWFPTGSSVCVVESSINAHFWGTILDIFLQKIYELAFFLDLFFLFFFSWFGFWFRKPG